MLILLYDRQSHNFLTPTPSLQEIFKVFKKKNF
jgi:hypothetical protein